MNLAWVAVITLLVVLEKTIPWGGQMRVLTGVLFIDWGVFNVIRAGFA
jgi:predicted metal-binding membrane protein